MLLCRWNVQPAPGQEKKFDHLDVRRQLVRTQRVGIGKLGVASKQSFDNGCDETTFKQVRRPRFFKRERRKECEIDGTVGDRTRKERIGDMVGLAQAQRQADHQLGADVTDDILRDGLGIGKYFHHYFHHP
jgi:hypothetical protein